MSDTPRTDALHERIERDLRWEGTTAVRNALQESCNFARELERAINGLNAQRTSHIATIDKLERELDKANARIDYLMSPDSSVMPFAEAVSRLSESATPMRGATFVSPEDTTIWNEAIEAAAVEIDSYEGYAGSHFGTAIRKLKRAKPQLEKP